MVAHVIAWFLQLALSFVQTSEAGPYLTQGRKPPCTLGKEVPSANERLEHACHEDEHCCDGIGFEGAISLPLQPERDGSRCYIVDDGAAIFAGRLR